MRAPVVTLASGLGHPEGPDILPDGRIVMVETYTSKIVAWSAERGLHDYALCGGGPNACMLGSDGALYITQNGGTVGAWRAEVMGRPSIQRAWPDGRVEEVVASVDGIELAGAQRPDIRTRRTTLLHRPRGLPPERPQARADLRARPDGTGELLEAIPDAYTNGIVAEADGSIVWVESYERGVYRKREGRPSERIAQLPEGHIPDGLKVAANGDLWVTAFMAGGVDILAPDGTAKDFLETGGVPLNCVFHDGSLYRHRLRGHHRRDGRGADGRPAVAHRRRRRGHAALPGSDRMRRSWT